MEIGIVIHLFATIVYALLIVYYFSYLSGQRLRKKRLAIPACLFLVVLCVTYSSPNYEYIRAATNILFLLAVCLLCNPQRRSLFYFAVLEVLRLFAEAITFYLLNVVNGTELCPSQWTSGQKSAWELVSIVLITAIAVSAARCLKSLPKTDIPLGNWVVYFLVPLGSVYILHYINSHSRHSYGTSLAAVLILLGINILVAMAFNHMIDAFQMKIAHHQLISQIEAATREQTDFLRTKAEISRITHDLKNHLMPIKLALEIKDYAAASESIGEILEKIVSEDIQYTGIAYIDSALNYKKGLCNSKGILLTVISVIQKPLAVNYFDMSIMLGAALDNSIDACEALSPPGEINVKIISKKNVFQVIVSNPYSHDIKVDGGGRIITTKADAEKHGFGMKCIHQLIEKNKGHFHYGYDGDCFTAKIVLYENF